MASKDIHPEDLGEFVVETKLERSNKLKEQMKEDVDFGKIKGKTSDFLLVGGAAKLAEEFGLSAILKQLIEEPFGDGCKITIILDIVEEDGKIVGTGVGTWDNGEMLGNMQAARQRGMAMAYKRAYVLGIRYASNAFGIFSQDEDIVKNADTPQKQSEWKPNQLNDSQNQGKKNKSAYDYGDEPFAPWDFDKETGAWIVNKGGHKGKDLIDAVREAQANSTNWVEWQLNNPNLVEECKKALIDAIEGRL